MGIGGVNVGIIERVRNLFKKGGEVLSTTNQLQSVLDHPKINGDKQEYQRIENSLMHYKNNYPKVSFINSNRQTVERELSSINMLKRVANQYASVVFNEQCEIEVEGGASEFIGQVFAHNDFKKNFSKYLEPMFALF